MVGAADGEPPTPAPNGYEPTHGFPRFPMSAPSDRSLPSSQQLGLWGFGGLLVLAVVFYVWWGLTYRVWIDNGVYAVVITMLLFGLAGLWLFWPTPETPPSA